MSAWNGFQNLDLSGVVPDDFAPLTPGEYELRSSDAQVKSQQGTNNKRVVVKLTATDGRGAINAGFNVAHSSKQAVEIGLAQLKSFLISGGHKNPDNPGDISSLNGLICRAYIGHGKPFIGQDGKERTNVEVKRFIMDGETGAGAGAGASAGASARKTYDDEIPF